MTFALSRITGCSSRFVRKGARVTTRGLSALLFISVLGIGFLAGISPPAMSQQVVDIVAVVNDQPITAYDLRQRLNLIIRSSSLKDTSDVRRDLAPRVVNALVNETLQLQEAKRLGIKVDQKEIDSTLALIERQNHIPTGHLDKFFKLRGIDKQTLIHQVRANLAWTDVVRRKFMRTITVTDEEIDRALQRLKDDAEAPRLLVAEIFIAVDNPRDDAEAKRNADRIFGELRKGASFPLLARQFSQSASAERGGDLGWVLPGELEPQVQKILSKIPVHSVTQPIHTASGYYIMALRDRREPPSKGTENTTLSLRQIVLDLPKNASKSDVQSQRDLAQTIRQSVRGCQDFLSTTQELNTKMSGDLGTLKLSELPPKIKEVVSNLKVGMPSQPVVSDNSVRVLMVCNRKTPSLNLPNREDVRKRLTIQRLEVRARRYLRELRDSAFLDIRGAS